MKSSSLYLFFTYSFPFLSFYLFLFFFASTSKIRERRFPEEVGGHLSVKSKNGSFSFKRDRGEMHLLCALFGPSLSLLPVSSIP